MLSVFLSSPKELIFLETNLILLAEASRASAYYAIVNFISAFAAFYIIRVLYYSIYNIYMGEGKEDFFSKIVSPIPLGEEGVAYKVTMYVAVVAHRLIKPNHLTLFN